MPSEEQLVPFLRLWYVVAIGCIGGHVMFEVGGIVKSHMSTFKMADVKVYECNLLMLNPF